jgi:3-methyladenine DNA glycosylase/8-oxoguanine DNA glycosylase
VTHRRLRLDHPLDVRATLGVLGLGRQDPCVRIAGDGVWRATRTPLGPGTLHVDDRHADAHRPGGSVVVRAWGPGQEWLLDRVEDLLGARDAPSSFAPADPVLADVHRRRPGVRFCRSLALTEALVPTILEQKVQTIAARRSWSRLARAFGEPAPGPADVLLPPDPDRLATTGYEAFHRFNVERRRADTIRRVCRHHRRIDALVALPVTEIDRRLRTIPGVGPWTSACAVQVAVGDADAVVVGDFHLPNTVSWALAGEPRATDDRMLELLEPYRGHRARVQRLLKYTGVRAPRYGPKLSVMAFADR